MERAALSQCPPEAASAGLASRSVNRSQKHGYDRHHRQFDDLSWPRSRDRPAAPSRGKTLSMSPEELRERLKRAGLTPYRLSYLLGVEPNEGSKWTRGDRPVPKGRVAQIIELTDFVAEHGAAAVPLPSLVRTANARIARRETGVLATPYARLVRPAVTRPEPAVSPQSPSKDGRPSTPRADLQSETRAGFGPLHSDFVRAHNLASQRGFER